AQGETLNDEDIARLSPLCHGHINMLGHYSFTLAELVTKGHLRRHCCKVSDEAAFCLIQRPYISKTLLTRRISPRGSP
ncbi:hypothetical protein, partial [Escherichia coli]|uniref:hypothetical protein n=1 Tax=Escherichia coli TaxID=562 RepID=UPI0039057EE8